jgi:DNA-binding NtrC family response regulator
VHHVEAIRSVLWVGDASSLPGAEIGQAPWLDVVWEPDLLRALELPPSRFHAVVLASNDPDRALIGLLDLRDHAGDTPVVIVGSDSVRSAAPELSRAGARKVLGPDTGSDLGKLFDWLAPQQRPTPSARGEAPPSTTYGLIGASRAMCELRRQIRRVADSDANVLVQGESGTGKELVAQAIHRHGRRHAGPFVALNCAALPETLLEAELLGSVRGAYTGADRDRTGLIEEASGGTLFLDEIAEASPALQAKLLRVLQERRVRPLGAREERHIDVRVIAATHRDLPREIAAERFRADLYYRLRVLPIAVAPLRKRTDDISILAHHFLTRFASQESKPVPTLEREAIRLLEAHTWPGNVRELENELHRALALSDGPRLGPADLAIDLGASAECAQDAWATRAPGETLRETLERVETWILRRSLESHAGRRAETARTLGLTREGLYKKLKRLNID